MPTLSLFFQKWLGGYPVDYRRIEGGRPSRSELGDNDPAAWETDTVTGKPKDPWQKTAAVVFINPEDEAVYTFSTPSGGGREALAKLAKAHGKKIEKSPGGGYPVVLILTGSYQHSDRSIGRDGWTPSLIPRYRCPR